MEILQDVCFWPIIDFPVPSRRCYLTAVGRTRELDRKVHFILSEEQSPLRENIL